MSSELENRTKAALKQFDNNMAGIFDRKSFYEGDKYSAEAGKPKLSGGQTFFKFFLLGLNVLFLIFGCVLMSVGSYALNNQVGNLTGQTIPSGLIVLGVFIMLLSLVGAGAAWRESRAALGFYFIFLLLFTIILFAVGIAVYVKKDQASDLILTAWNAADDGIKVSLQNNLDCCDCRADGSVPPKFDNGTYNYYLGCPSPQVSPAFQSYPQGCLPVMVNWFNKSFKTAGACGIAFSIIMLAGLIFVCYLMSGIKRKVEETDIQKLRTGGGEVVINTTVDEEQPAQEMEEGETQ